MKIVFVNINDCILIVIFFMYVEIEKRIVVICINKYGVCLLKVGNFV